MAPLYLNEADVEQLLPMELAIDAVDDVLIHHAQGLAENISRGRARTDGAMLHLMGGADRVWDQLACKMYVTTKKGVQFHVHLYDGQGDGLLAVMEADKLGQLRTGAASGVATRALARPDAQTVGVFGSGWQARSQLHAVCAVRHIKSVNVYSPTAENREKFAKEMSSMLHVDVTPVDQPAQAAEDLDIIITATKSTQPVLEGKWIKPGAHLNIIGANFLFKSEVDVETIARCDVVAVDDMEQARLEAGDFQQALARSELRWPDVVELGQILAMQRPGRTQPQDITLFKSIGLGIEDLAVARVVYQRARDHGRGQFLFSDGPST